MIRKANGRDFSTRTQEEELALFKQRLAVLTEEERAVFRAVISDSIANNSFSSNDGLKALLEGVEYEQKPVSMEEFLFQDYYLGRSGRKVYPKLVDDLFELFDGKYYLAVFTGGIGYGKSFVATMALLRIIYLMTCMRSPQASYGLADGSVMTVTNMSVTLRLAQKVVFESVANILSESPYFKEACKFEMTMNEIRLPKSIWYAPSTSADSSVLGLNVIAGVCDESNFLDYNPRGKVSTPNHREYSKAETLFNAIMRRMKSRYVQAGGALPGILFVLSSVRTPEDFTNQLIRESRDDPGVFVRNYALYDTRPVFMQSKRFKVLVGNERVRSRVVTDDNKVEVDRLVEVNKDDGVYTIDVPEEFRQDFDRDLDGSLRDIAGIATVAVHPFIQKYEKIEEMIDPMRVHPFTLFQWDSEEPLEVLWDQLTKVEDGRTIPRVNPNAPRFVHIDLGVTGDAAGVCMGHVAGMRQVVRRNPSEDKATVEVAPIIYIDFILRIIPPKYGEISFGNIRSLLYKMIEHGFSIQHASLDSFQSVDMLQQFRLRGIVAEKVSIDISILPYEAVKSALYENRVSCYSYPPLNKELRELEKNVIRNRVDHPPKGSKDVSDAFAGVVYTLSISNVAEGYLPQPLLVGRSEYGRDESVTVIRKGRGGGHDIFAEVDAEDAEKLAEARTGSLPFLMR